MRMPPLAAALTLALACLSCAHVGLARIEERSWRSGSARAARPVAYARPRVECRSGAVSIEDEIEMLAPLLFLQNGFFPAAADRGAEFIVAVTAVEREIPDGWRTIRSISVDLRALRNDGTTEPDTAWPPEAAVRIVSSGGVSLSSSAELARLLSRGVRRLADELKRTEGARSK